MMPLIGLVHLEVVSIMFHAKLCTALDKFKTLFVKYRISKWEQMWLRSMRESRTPISYSIDTHHAIQKILWLADWPLTGEGLS